ncbi:MAG: putative nucleic-acid-binding protein containing a Zn-ribbon [Halonotius sp. J07HN4]|nr:MAG: putative nucleic-acid-binding protein containing a Zn-ribbon [Halonotius sp. J07HN4]
MSNDDADISGDDTAGDDDSTTDNQPASYTAWLDALEAGEGFALESPTGERSLPPRRVDPATGATELCRKPLSETGTIETYTVVHVAAPGFADDTPYVSAIADFDSVRITGIVRGVDPDSVDADFIGTEVRVTVETRATTDDRLVVLLPIG